LPTKIDISKKKLERLYWKEGLSINKISKRLSLNKNTIYDMMVQKHIQRRNYSNALRFSIKEPNKQTLAYLAGVLAGDGNINSNGTFELQTIDHDFAVHTFNRLDSIAPAKFIKLKRKTSAGNPVFSIRLHRRKFNDLLQKVKITNITHKNWFINGIIDSEACVNNSNRTVSIYMDNKNLLIQIQSYLKSQKIHSRLYCRNGLHYSLVIIRKDSILKFHKYFRFSIKRKEDKLKQIILNYRR